MTTVALVGSTGSIGTQAIEVVDAEPDRYEVVALGAARSVEALAEQARRLRPLQTLQSLVDSVGFSFFAS